MDNRYLDEHEFCQPDVEPVQKLKTRRVKMVIHTTEGRTHTYQACIKCGGTSYGKPYCIEHLDEMPYVKYLRESMHSE